MNEHETLIEALADGMIRGNFSNEALRSRMALAQGQAVFEDRELPTLQDFRAEYIAEVRNKFGHLSSQELRSFIKKFP